MAMLALTLIIIICIISAVIRGNSILNRRKRRPYGEGACWSQYSAMHTAGLWILDDLC